LHPDVAAHSALKDMKRELTLQEIAVMTRAAPARLLGLSDRGHLGVGAAADIAIYRDDPIDRERMFTTPEWVFKDGRVVARAGRINATPVGGTHFVTPRFDDERDTGFAEALRERMARNGSLHPQHLEIGHDELCACCRGGRLLPTECFVGAAS
jgi:formylmethanofuran dehydrogenase subunit A